MVRLTDRPDMTLDVYRGRKTTIQQQQQQHLSIRLIGSESLLCDHLIVKGIGFLYAGKTYSNLLSECPA